MNDKLTLNLDKHLIERAKHYAKSYQTSLSQLVENYLYELIRKEDKKDFHQGVLPVMTAKEYLDAR